jgi:hypothetical protein
VSPSEKKLAAGSLGSNYSRQQNIPTPFLPTKDLFRPSYISLLLCFFITFFFPSTLAPHHKPLALYTTTMNDDSKGKSLFQHPGHLSLTLLSLTSSTITLFSRHN